MADPCMLELKQMPPLKLCHLPRLSPSPKALIFFFLLRHRRLDRIRIVLKEAHAPLECIVLCSFEHGTCLSFDGKGQFRAFKHFEGTCEINLHLNRRPNKPPDFGCGSQPSYCTKQSPNLLPSRTQTRVAPKTLTLHRQEKGKLQTAFISYTVLTSHSLLGATPRKRSLAVGEAIFSLRMALGELFDQLDHGEIPINCSILSIPCYPGPFQKKITPWRSE